MKSASYHFQKCLVDNAPELSFFAAQHTECLFCIPYTEQKEVIVEAAFRFEAEHEGTTWTESDYYAEITSFAEKTFAKELWSRFGDVPMNPDTETIDEAWNSFPKGTHREEIWHWFEETFHVSAADLMRSTG